MGEKKLTVQQVRRAVDVSIEAALLKPEARRKCLHRTAMLIARVQQRNAKARHSHHRRRIRLLHQLNIHLKHCRCCIPPHPDDEPALSY